MKVQISEDWQRDALVLIAYRPSGDGERGLVLQPSMPVHPGEPVHFRLRPTGEEPEGPVGVGFPEDVARALYEALGRHFGEHRDPASRELTDVLKDVVGKEGERVDHLIGVLTGVVVQPVHRNR